MNINHDQTSPATQQRWLKRYYYVRAVFSLVWVAMAFVLAPRDATIAAILLMIYPAWDAVATGRRQSTSW
jgi:hypothetical protein